MTGQPNRNRDQAARNLGLGCNCGLVGILAAAIWYALHALRMLAGVDMPAGAGFTLRWARITLAIGAG